MLLGISEGVRGVLSVQGSSTPSIYGIIPLKIEIEKQSTLSTVFRQSLSATPNSACSQVAEEALSNKLTSQPWHGPERRP